MLAALIGALAGSLAGPAAAAIMAIGGAVIGNATDLSTEDDFNEFANNIADAVIPGGAAVVADVNEGAEGAFAAAMQSLGGAVKGGDGGNSAKRRDGWERKRAAGQRTKVVRWRVNHSHPVGTE